jgi:hypothetical protein
MLPAIVPDELSGGDVSTSRRWMRLSLTPRGARRVPPGPIREIGMWAAAEPGATRVPPGPMPPGV